MNRPKSPIFSQPGGQRPIPAFQGFERPSFSTPWICSRWKIPHVYAEGADDLDETCVLRYFWTQHVFLYCRPTNDVTLCMYGVWWSGGAEVGWQQSFSCDHLYASSNTLLVRYALNLLLELPACSWCYVLNWFLELSTRSWCCALNLLLELPARSWRCYALSWFLELNFGVTWSSSFPGK